MSCGVGFVVNNSNLLKKVGAIGFYKINYYCYM